MPANKLSDLLPIADGQRPENAYDVFGLSPGESDAKRIDAAISRTVAKLTSSRSDADPKLWTQAAKLASEAQITLTDPDQKSKLDSSLEQTASTVAAAADPLAGLLPSGDPLADVLPAADPLKSDTPPSESPSDSPTDPTDPTEETVVAANQREVRGREEFSAGEDAGHAASSGHVGGSEQLPERSAETAFATFANDPNTEFSAGEISLKVDDDRPDRRSPGNYRRRKSKWPGIFFTLATFSLVAIAGTLAYFVFFGPGELAITKSDRGINFSAGANRGASTTTSTPASTTSGKQQPPRGDSIIGNVPSDTEAVKGRPSGLVSGMAPSQTPAPAAEIPSGDTFEDEEPAAEPTTMTGADQSPAITMDEPEKPENPTGDDPPKMVTEVDGTMSDEPEMNVDTPATTATEQDNQEAAAQLQQVRELIRQANWNEMKQAAETALEMPMSPAQQQEAEGLYQLADLATFYRGGIQQAVQELQVGNDFVVSDDFRVIVVEANRQRLVVRFDASNRTFTLDELPFVLAHKLATFKMPQSPAAKAAKAAYQAVAPRATGGHRAQSIDWLLEIEQQVEGADPQRVADVIRELYLD